MSKDAEQGGVVPGLRFPEFRESVAWTPRTFGNVVKRIKKKVPTSEVALVDYVSTENLRADFAGMSQAGNLPPAGTVTEYQPGDVLFANIRPYLRKGLAAEGKGGASNDVFVFRSASGLQSAFLAHRILSDDFVAYVMAGAKGLKMPRGDLKQIERMRFPIPAPAEQRKIAACLGSLDDWIAAEARALAALRRHKTGLMQQLFPRPGETRPRLRFPEFQNAGDWEEVALGKLLQCKPEYGVNAAAVAFSENLPAYVRITDISEDGSLVDAGRVSVDIVANEEDFLQSGDIVLARTGASVGKSYRYREADGRLVFAGFLIRIRPEPNHLLPAFLAGYLATWQYWDWVRVNSARSGQPGINGTEYADMPVPRPPSDEGDPAEQRRIATCLASLDTRLAAHANKLAALRLHKRGLMQQLFPPPDDRRGGDA